MDFDLAATLSSGQVFHWQPAGEGFVGMISALPIYVEQHGDTLRFAGGSPELIANYFALDHPLAEICASFPDDPVMRAARNFCTGLRIIRQPKWECLATFICSSMKQVAHIRQISHKLRERFGEPRSIQLSSSVQHADGGSTYKYLLYSFPTAERIAASSEKGLRECALGYRAKNLLATAHAVASGEADLDAWSALSDAELRAQLCALPGVGSKVANCVMLFAYERLEAFPIDVWIERVLREKYFTGKRKVTSARLREFAGRYFGEHGGYAQQYLFHHARMNSRNGKGNRDGSRSSPARRMSPIPPPRKGAFPGAKPRKTAKVLNSRQTAFSKIGRPDL